MTASSSEKGMRSAMTASGGRPEDAAMLASAAQEPGPAGGRSGVGKVTAIKSVGTYAHRAVHSGGNSSAEGSSTKSAQLPAVLSLRTGARLVNPGKSEGQMAPNRGLLRHTHRGLTCCDLKALKDYGNWVGETLLDVHYSVIRVGGWQTVFPGALPRWASRIRQYFNLTPMTLKLLDHEESSRHLEKAQTALPASARAKARRNELQSRGMGISFLCAGQFDEAGNTVSKT